MLSYQQQLTEAQATTGNKAKLNKLVEKCKQRMTDIQTASQQAKITYRTVAQQRQSLKQKRDKLEAYINKKAEENKTLKRSVSDMKRSLDCVTDLPSEAASDDGIWDVAYNHKAVHVDHYPLQLTSGKDAMTKGLTALLEDHGAPQSARTQQKSQWRPVALPPSGHVSSPEDDFMASISLAPADHKHPGNKLRSSKESSRSRVTAGKVAFAGATVIPQHHIAGPCSVRGSPDSNLWSFDD